MKGNREYKSDVFSMLMEDKAYALDVYNALNHSHYNKPEDVEMILLERYVSLTVRNDASFIIGMDMNFYEHQSTYNPNMPLRGLLYYADTMEHRIKECNINIFGRKLVEIPTPKFVVFYNGVEKRPAVEKMKLSEAFINKEENIQLELVCTVYNLNAVENQDLLGNSQVLYGYTIFVQMVRERIQLDYSLDDAIDYAINECIHNHILEEFFVSRKDEVRKMTKLDFTWERQEQLIRMEEREEGRAEGQLIALLTMIVKKREKGYTPQRIAEELEENPDRVSYICRVADEFAPEYDIQKIYEIVAGKGQ